VNESVRIAELEGKLDAIAAALGMPAESWRIAGCDVLAHQVADTVRNSRKWFGELLQARASIAAADKPEGKAEQQAEPVAWLATDLDGRGDVAFTKEEARRRAGEGCTYFYPLIEPVAHPPAQPQQGLTDAEILDAVKTALPEFRHHDDYLLSPTASLMSSDSHEIIHIDTACKIVRALLSRHKVSGEDKEGG